MFAVVRTGGKQYRVAKNDTIEVESLDAKEGASIDLDILAFSADGKKLALGKDISGAKVSAKVVSHIRDEKVVVFKKKRRQNYRRTAGHRQHLTVLEITDIKAA
ncbi:MAG: 50S ribosomal protein L21 [Micavibrio aeruginosavorus]|uniref:Large ribosomal subunit protein bL21 n=1 Tax=Micavibrio aeruginosavorus TaxID=349221 RepID=A0A2W5MRM3_9BACT|nr:MAG: 50S ribosomal protein L21 [Micavibrio aeruginosavorus]